MPAELRAFPLLRLRIVWRQVTITDGSKSLRWLNEIEYINGEVWGMVWQTECIARIDPKDGSVIGWILMDGCANNIPIKLILCKRLCRVCGRKKPG